MYLELHRLDELLKISLIVNQNEIIETTYFNI